MLAKNITVSNQRTRDNGNIRTNELRSHGCQWLFGSEAIGKQTPSGLTHITRPQSADQPMRQ